MNTNIIPEIYDESLSAVVDNLAATQEDVVGWFNGADYPAPYFGRYGDEVIAEEIIRRIGRHKSSIERLTEIVVCIKNRRVSGR